MKRLMVCIMLPCALACLAPRPVSAQVAWDAPMLMPPKAPDGFGLFLVDVYGGGLGVLGTWRSPAYGFGLRGGLADANGNNIGAFGAVDFNGELTRSTEEFPIDIDWVAGLGIGIVHGALISAPLGLSLGHDFAGNDVGFTPYLTPRVVLDACLDCGRRENSNDLNLDFAVDIGLDLALTRGLRVRFGATLGDREGVGIGLVF
jgi:hypothetical protein